MRIAVNHKTYDVSRDGDQLAVNGVAFTIRTDGHGRRRIVTVDGRPYAVELPNADGAPTVVHVDGTAYDVADLRQRRTAAPTAVRATLPPVTAAVPGRVVAPMAGRILRLAVEAGETVEQGALLVILEAMKMENELRAPRAGKVNGIDVSVGQRVSAGQQLLMLA